MAKKKRTKTKTKRISFKLGTSKRKKQRKIAQHLSLMGILKVLAVACVLVAIGALFYFAQRYVKSAKPVEAGPLELVDVPEWVSEELKAKILAATGAKTVRLDEKAARLVAENLASAAWVDNVKVKTTNKSVRVSAEFRKPIALVKSGLHKFYVDAELVVLDFVPMSNLPIVRIKGLSVVTKVPPPGSVWQRDDLAAAVAVLDRLDRRDKDETLERPLLYDIDIIDVSNFNGRQDSRFPHIVLYAMDNTEIVWGAEIGAWQRHLEATDEQKIAKLYGYYKEHGSLLNSVKYINLRDPQDNIPLPIDKY